MLLFFNTKTITPKLKYGLQPQSSIRVQLNNSQSIKCWSFVKIWPLTLQYQVSENPLFFEDDGHAATFKGENCCFSVTQKSLTLLSMKSLREMSQTNYHLSTQSEDVPVKVLLWWAEVCDIGCWKQTTTSQIIPYVNTSRQLTHYTFSLISYTFISSENIRRPNEFGWIYKLKKKKRAKPTT